MRRNAAHWSESGQQLLSRRLPTVKLPSLQRRLLLVADFDGVFRLLAIDISTVTFAGVRIGLPFVRVRQRVENMRISRVAFAP